MSLKSGQACPRGCGGRLRVATSRRINDDWQKQHLECNLHCGFKGTAIAAASSVWRRVFYDRTLGVSRPNGESL